MAKKTYKSGFTLIELLVVMIVVGIIGGDILSILFSILRGTNKTNRITQIRQNGNYALNLITRMIRNSNGATSCNGSPTSDITVSQPDGSATRFYCDADTGIASESASFTSYLIDSSNLSATSCQFTCTPDSVTGIPFVKFNFVISEKVTTSTEKKASVTFTGSTQLRNTRQ